ncbi:hypothetical protein [Spongiactinospora sp. TRM90649]|uniref:hypothetical protein n=1 Tax=Spongiactinospora sp. TRM90649 TaxID=3031114 RepID=UPI0023F7ED02|nr:hypothetical protein [Spongiactinospora sp. TRM90649]MDF5756001.1 hypothetical protein [Spongiactinospora sp. TRM90649]
MDPPMQMLRAFPLFGAASAGARITIVGVAEKDRAVRRSWSRVFAQLTGIPLPVAQVAVRRGAFTPLKPDADVLAREQRVADAFAEAGLIPAPIKIARHRRPALRRRHRPGPSGPRPRGHDQPCRDPLDRRSGPVHQAAGDEEGRGLSSTHA